MKRKYADSCTEDEGRDNNNNDEDNDENEEGSEAFSSILLKNGSETLTKK